LRYRNINQVHISF